MNADDAIRLFGLNNLSIESDLRRIHQTFDLQRAARPVSASTKENDFYPQFPIDLRMQAESMARHYAIFYCLENSIRQIIKDRLEEEYGVDWWDIKVPKPVAENASKNRQKELQSGVTLRSDDLIDYSNFGELDEIIKANWEIFGDMFRDLRAVERILNNLNTLRAPIAHCNALAEDEVMRLDLGLRDWFRQME
jgi:Swt1-like HEPN